MAADISQLVNAIQPEKTVLLFGAGSSLPSNAPSSGALASRLANNFSIAADGFSLSEIASIAEQKFSRKRLVSELRSSFASLRPTGGLLNLPLYNWKSLYTTNYDELIEYAYSVRSRDLTVYSSNFDFTIHDKPEATKLFKIHGTIGKDVTDGAQSRLIITETDYDHTSDYRESIFDRLKGDLAGAHLIIIGHSLADPDIRDIVNRAAAINSKAHNGGLINLLLYSSDENRAALYERRGISVYFGGIDEFFAKLAARQPLLAISTSISNDALDQAPILRAITIDVAHAADVRAADASAMFNGWPAKYADIAAGYTFSRLCADDITQFLCDEENLCAVLLGASGVGKTTTARQALLSLYGSGRLCWEHKGDHALLSERWLAVASWLKENDKKGVLLIDEAHSHLQEVNDLIDRLAAEKSQHFKLILVSTRNHWNPRVKSPNIFKHGREFKLVQLKAEEIERLLQLIDMNGTISSLVEPVFSGFSRQERRRRLVERCEADMFVCLKNIFASESFDDILLREYAGLAGHLQEIYRFVAAMETAGIRVHRQLVIRLLGVPSQEISAALTNLTDIIHEYTISEKEGVYGWRTRHGVIASIISKFKFSDIEKVIDLFERVIDCIHPTYEIEIRTLRELCNVDSGLPRIPDKGTQNRLLRKMMSIAPGERVPRHRLIRNLIEMGAFEKAETEIRIFDKDFGADGPVYRYRVNLLVARAVKTPGILTEDRIALLEQARELASIGTQRYPSNKNMLSAYVELGIEYYKKTGRYSYYDEAMEQLKAAEERLGDPEISKLIARYERRIAGHSLKANEEPVEIE